MFAFAGGDVQFAGHIISSFETIQPRAIAVHKISSHSWTVTGVMENAWRISVLYYYVYISIRTLFLYFDRRGNPSWKPRHAWVLQPCSLLNVIRSLIFFSIQEQCDEKFITKHYNNMLERIHFDVWPTTVHSTYTIHNRTKNKFNSTPWRYLDLYMKYLEIKRTLKCSRQARV